MVGALAHAEDAWQTKPSQVIFSSDKPSEMITEINGSLAPEQRLFWYINAQVDNGLYPGVSGSFNDVSIHDIVLQQCQTLGLQLGVDGRHVWMYSDDQQIDIDQLTLDLKSETEATRLAAIDQLVTSNTIAGVTALLTHWASGMPEGRSGIALLLGAQRAELGNKGALTYALWGNPDRQRWYHLPLLEHHQIKPMSAPWAGLKVALGQQAEARQAAQTIIREHNALQTDVVALSLGIILGEPSKELETALGAWCANPAQSGGFNRGGKINTP